MEWHFEEGGVDLSLIYFQVILFLFAQADACLLAWQTRHDVALREALNSSDVRDAFFSHLLQNMINTAVSPSVNFESLNKELLMNAPALWQYRLSKVTQSFIVR